MIAKVICGGFYRRGKVYPDFFCAPRLLGIMVVWGAEEGRRYGQSPRAGWGDFLDRNCWDERWLSADGLADGIPGPGSSRGGHADPHGPARQGRVAGKDCVAWKTDLHGRPVLPGRGHGLNPGGGERSWTDSTLAAARGHRELVSETKIRVDPRGPAAAIPECEFQLGNPLGLLNRRAATKNSRSVVWVFGQVPLLQGGNLASGNWTAFSELVVEQPGKAGRDARVVVEGHLVEL